MKIAAGADHAGYPLKEHLVDFLRRAGHEVRDLGTHSEASVDYPDFAAAVGRAVAGGDAELGLLVCGTGIGVSIAANKVDGVRAASCCGIYAARMARAHNDANVLTLGARIVAAGLAEEITHTFLDTSFEGDRHARRVGKIHDLE